MFTPPVIRWAFIQKHTRHTKDRRREMKQHAESDINLTLRPAAEIPKPANPTHIFIYIN